MSTRLLLIAHAPLAHALRACALHVLGQSADDVLALDVPPDAAPEDTLALAQRLLQCPGAAADAPTLVLTDVFGATPCNVARRLVEGQRCATLVSGVNLSMLLRAVTYRAEPLESLVQRAMLGGTQGVMQVACSSGAAPASPSVLCP